MVGLVVILVLLGLEIFLGLRILKFATGAVRYFSLGGIVIAICITIFLLVAGVSVTLSPGNSILDRIQKFAETKRNKSLVESESAREKVDELNQYADCMAAAQATEEMEKCKSNLSPAVREKLDGEKSQMPSFEDFPKSSADSKKILVIPLVVNCEKSESTAEKTVCANPELNALNNRLAEFNTKRKTSRPTAELVHWWKELKLCDDDVSCLKKQYDDELYRVTH